MLRWARRLIRQLGCRRHRWRPDRRRPGIQFCDLCGARQEIREAKKSRRTWAPGPPGPGLVEVW